MMTTTATTRLAETGEPASTVTAPAVRATAVARPAERRIVLEGVSKFYGEVLGVNRVDLRLEPGITGLVGPNGSGKTTLMNLIAGLLTPDQGRLSVLGLGPDRPEDLFRLVGYSTQYDGFPRGVTGFRFVYGFLRLHGYAHPDAEALAWQAIERVNLVEAAKRKVAGYSKGMRQRIRLAQAIAHRPAVLILDEPLNGLDPMARAEMIDLFRHQADEGLHVLISSHILHEVDDLSDRVVLINGGYVVAEGEIEGVREEVEEQPLQVLVRCDRPALVARRLFDEEHVTEVSLHADGGGLFVRSKDADRLHLTLNRVIVEEGLAVEAVAPADADMGAVYQYLIGGQESTR
ncbi:MAG TPA: ABC transporter ATP-binding protein [Thermoanaerobaculia bacterium]|nr:ABC transporter ATP-binding protein [Thermoanaerobaculia bacterium]